MKPLNYEMGERLYELRRKRGLNQEQLADELGVSRQAVSKWERGESQPDVGNLIALSNLYGVSIDYLAKGDPDDKPDDAKMDAEACEEKNEAAPAQSADSSKDPETEKASFPPPINEQPLFVNGAPQPMPGALPSKSRNPWLTFPYPLLVAVLFLLGGFLFGAWNPGWVLFLTIPFYYWMASVIARDPVYKEDHS